MINHLPISFSSGVVCRNLCFNCFVVFEVKQGRAGPHWATSTNVTILSMCLAAALFIEIIQHSKSVFRQSWLNILTQNFWDTVVLLSISYLDNVRSRDLVYWRITIYSKLINECNTHKHDNHNNTVNGVTVTKQALFKDGDN